MNGDKRQESLMRRVQIAAFVEHECTLYLDCHPNNKRALERHKQAVAELNEAVKEYEAMYGPLTSKSAGGQDWNWIRGRWPWQNYED